MKKILITLLVLFLAIPVFAQHTNIFKLDDFSKLLSSHVSPYVLPNNAASTALNVRASDSYGSLSKRSKMDSYGSIGANALTSLHRFYKSDDTAYLIATGSTDVYVGNDSTGIFQTISDNMNTGLRFDWITYKDNAIGCNGTNACVKYDGKTQITANTDGSRTASNVVAELGAPYAELNTGANLDASAWYQYKMMFYDSVTNYYSTRVSNPILTGSTVRDVTLTDIPLGIAGTTNRYIYRTEGQATEADLSSATYYLAITISDNSTVTDDDDMTDATLVGETEWSISGKTNISPPIGQFVEIHRERVFIANAPSLNAYMYWSEAFYPEFFSAADYEFIRVDDGDEITFLETVTGRLVIGKTNSITNFATQYASDTDWRLYTMNFIGCPAPWSVAQTPNGIVYLGWDGLYVYNGEISTLISEAVTPEIKDILQSNIDEVAGIYANNEYNLAYTSIESGAFNNNRILIYDIVSDFYAIDTKDVNTFAFFNSGNDYGTLYYGSSGTDGNVYAEASDVSTFILRYKSEFDAGTRDSIVISGSENDPQLEIGWGITINDESTPIDPVANMSAITLDSLSFSSATINRPGLVGYWWSPSTQVDASNYEKLYWNEILGANGDITLVVRSGAASSDALTGNFSSEFTDPSGSDVSGETANNYVQIRATLTTTDITDTPYLVSLDNFSIKLLYSKVGVAAETAINSLWQGGWQDFDIPTIPKRIWGINVYYTGTEGTMTVGLKNERGDIDQSFDIDLSLDPTSSTDDEYFGSNTNKIYKWLAPINSETTPTPIGRLWRFTIEEGGVTSWNVYSMDVKFSQENFYED